MTQATATPYDVIALVLRVPFPQIHEVVIIDATPTIDGRPESELDPLELENWAVEKYADGREVRNVVFFPTDAEARAWAGEFYGA